MKTLDEVIEGYERCHGAYGTDESCEYCPLFDICEHDPQMASPWDDDMYHYLKEFQGLSKMWNDKLDKEQENPPLDWETLKHMERKPVWVEMDKPDVIKAWFLICQIDDSFVWVADSKGKSHNFPRVCLDTGLWQAYRKERA